MHAVNAHPARSSIGSWCLAYANGVTHGADLGEGHAEGLVARAFAQVVQVRDRKVCQALVAGIPIHGVGAAQQMHNGWATDICIGTVHLGEQFDIGGRVLAGKGGSGGAVAFGQWHRGQPVLVPASHQANDLGAAVATGAAQVGQHHAALHLASLAVPKALQNPTDVLVALGITAAYGVGEADLRSCAKNSCSCAIVRSFVSSMLITIQGMIKPTAGSPHIWLFRPGGAQEQKRG